MAIQEAYAAAVRQHGFEEDAAQQRVVDALATLQARIVSEKRLATRLRDILPWSRPSSGARGIYLWGGVGRGKTFLMDLFFASLELQKKKRVHFHRMMRDVHARLKAHQAVEDPLDRVAADVARETRVLCFDEFFVSDIADAMILGRLLQALFDRGVILVATSNAPPAELYRDGLQRERFLPAIASLEEHTEVIELDGGTDYRLRLLQEAGTFLTPADEKAHGRLKHYFDEVASGDVVEAHVLDVLGRAIPTQRCAKGVVWFDFTDLCDGPRSQEDYIEISRWFPTVIVSNVPQLTTKLEDQARRFIALVDEFYDRRVKLLLSAAVGIESLYRGERLTFEFERTGSRLIEMQSADYLHAPHVA